jgi:hypothetical protein
VVGPSRWLVVESTPRAKANAARLTAAQQAGRGMLATRQEQWQRRTFACEADAQQAAALCLRERRWHSHHLTDTVSPAWGPTKRATRGRPRKDVPPPQRQVWRVMWQVQEATDAISRWAQRERRLVLVTKVVEAQQLSDTARLRAYQGQPAAELSCTWAKNPAAIAPILLDTPTRMAALSGVYLIARLVSTLVERQVRQGLAARGGNTARAPGAQPAPHGPQGVPPHAHHGGGHAAVDRASASAGHEPERPATPRPPSPGLCTCDLCDTAPKFRVIQRELSNVGCREILDASSTSACVSRVA